MRKTLADVDVENMDTRVATSTIIKKDGQMKYGVTITVHHKNGDYDCYFGPDEFDTLYAAENFTKSMTRIERDQWEIGDRLPIAAKA